MLTIDGLPTGLSCRPATADDAWRVVDLIAACEQHDLGEVFIEADDVAADWQRPSFDLATQSIMVFATDELVAYGEVFKGRRAEVVVHPVHRGRGVGSALLAWTWRVARWQGSSLVGQMVPETLTDAISLFRRHGYQQLWVSWVLEFPQGQQIPVVEPPDGVSVREFVPGRDEQAAYQVIEDAFSEWPNREPTSYDDWAAGSVRRPGFEVWNLLLAVDGNEVVGACHVIPSGDAAWIHQLAVRRDHRGRGLARVMMLAAFARARAHGVDRAELSTDSRTGALGLYEHVGMRVKKSFSHWAKQLSAVAAGTPLG